MAPQQREKSGLKGLHNSLVKERSSGACASLCQHVFISFFRAFFLTYLIQSSRLSSWLVVFFSWSSLNENLLSWSHSLCVLISSSLLADFVMTNVFSSSFLLDFVFLFVCMMTRSVSALSGAEHSFSCSFAVVQVS